MSATEGHYLKFQVDKFCYATPIRLVSQVIRAVASNPMPYHSDTIAGTINVHGNIIPLIHFRTLIGLPSITIRPQHFFLLTNQNEVRLAFVIDEVFDLFTSSDNKLLKLNKALSIKDSVDSVKNATESIILFDDPTLALKLNDSHGSSHHDV